MFEGLQKKWGVTAGRLILILVTFAVGGSLSGIVAKELMSLTGIKSKALYIPIYIIVVTIVWPFMVLGVSIFTGQLPFFRKYLGSMGKRMGIMKKIQTGNETLPRHGDVEVLNQKEPRKEDQNYLQANTSTRHITIFASGAGSNAQKIIDHFRRSGNAKVVLVVCNKVNAGVTEIARKENIPLLLIEKERFQKGDGYVPELRQAGTDLIVLAGFLWKIPDSLINEYRQRIINIHPALLPNYGGKGMYGNYVHEAVLGAGDVQSGITIHYVDEHYDHGDVIFQTACPVLPGDTTEKLAQRIHQLEHNHYPVVIEDLIKKL